jgi:hypothetical protein
MQDAEIKELPEGSFLVMVFVVNYIRLFKEISDLD